MYVSNKAPYISIISLSNVLKIDEQINLVSPELYTDPNDILSSEIFEILRPGKERVVVLLLGDGLNRKSISEIMGINEKEVKRVIDCVKAKVVRKFDIKRL